MIPFTDGLQCASVLEHACAKVLVFLETVRDVLVIEPDRFSQLLFNLVLLLACRSLITTCVTIGPLGLEAIGKLVHSLLQVSFGTRLLNWVRIVKARVENSVTVLTIPCAQNISGCTGGAHKERRHYRFSGGERYVLPRVTPGSQYDSLPLCDGNIGNIGVTLMS